MRGLGGRRATTSPTVRGTAGRARAALLVSLVVLLAGCGGGDDGDSPGTSGESSSPTSSSSPSEPATSSALQGGTRVEGPVFTLTIPAGYELYDQDDGGEFTSWTRAYSLPINTVTRVRVRYTATQRVLPLDEKIESTRRYLISGGIDRDRIRRAEDTTLASHPTVHLVGRSRLVEAHAYLIDLGERYLEILLERDPDDSEQERAQQAMLDSIRLTG